MKSRSQKAIRNTFWQLVLELVTVICGLILPRLILSRFGSAYNGITQSISQFISCVALLKSGIGSVTRAALYKPLAQNDSVGVSKVVNATERFMRRIALIFGVSIVGFAAVYPFLVSDDFSWVFAFTLVLILSVSTVAQYCFGLTYQMLIEADQNNYIVSVVTILSTVINTLIASVLIYAGCSIHTVKMGSALIFVVPPIFYLLYARKKYRVDKSVPADSGLISQRWDAFAHQLSNFINDNTDIMVTTVFLGVKEVSVYAVYNMIANNMRKLVNSFTSSTTSAFGNMIANQEYKTLKARFDQFELLVFGVCTAFFTSTAILYQPFIDIYTRGVTDADYHRPLLGVLFCVACFFACVKLIYENVVFAAGEFKSTKRLAYWEAGINIGVSLILVNFLGIAGVLIGTIVAGLFRSLTYNVFASRKIVRRNPFTIVLRLVYTALCVALCWLATLWIPLATVKGYLPWAGWACCVVAIVAVITFGLALLLFRKDTLALLKVVISRIKRK